MVPKVFTFLLSMLAHASCNGILEAPLCHIDGNTYIPHGIDSGLFCQRFFEGAALQRSL